MTQPLSSSNFFDLPMNSVQDLNKTFITMRTMALAALALLGW
ncbi:hypothetical protein [Hymenobacter sp. 102]